MLREARVFCPGPAVPFVEPHPYPGVFACCLSASPQLWRDSDLSAGLVLAAVEAISNHCSRLRSIAVFAPYPVTVEAIALEAALRKCSSADEMITGATAADFVLGPNRFDATVQSNLPGFNFLNQAEAALDAEVRWKRLALPGLADPPVL